MNYDDIDIFKTGREMQRGSYSPPESLDLTPAQTAYLAGALVDPQGAADFTGNYFEFPTSNMSIKDMLEGPRAPSFVENLRQRNFGDATLQGIGALPIPFLAGAMKYIKAAGKLGRPADEVNVSYRMQHQPTAPEDAARLDDMTRGGEVFTDDIYS